MKEWRKGESMEWRAIPHILGSFLFQKRKNMQFSSTYNTCMVLKIAFPTNMLFTKKIISLIKNVDSLSKQLILKIIKQIRSEGI